MLRQIKVLTKLELCSLYGVNVFRFSKDKKAKGKAALLMGSWAILAFMLVFYMGGLSYGLIYLGLEKAVFPYLIMISTIVNFSFGVLKAGGVIFRKNGYDMLCSLPVAKTAIVASRFFRMYVESLVVMLGVILPGLAVYDRLVKPEPVFYLLSGLGLFFVPLLPVSAAVFIGALVTAVSSRMRHKSLVATILTMLAVFAILALSSGISVMENNINPELLKDLSGLVMSLLEKVYPPAIWLSKAAEEGDFFRWILCIGFSLAVFLGAAFLVASRFHSICQNLYSTSATHNYQMGALRKDSILVSLCRRELKRYFSSSIYVTNTIIGPVLGTVFSGAVLFTGTDFISKEFSAFTDIHSILPFILAGAFCLMPTTAVSISMEGRNWWILKSLPLAKKSILDAKILMNLVVALPFYLLSEGMLLAALRPKGFDIAWLLFIPVVSFFFSSVFGIAVNLAFPVLEWENEARIVKQSASSFLGGLGGFFVVLLGIAGCFFVPSIYRDIFQLLFCLVLLGVTALLRWNSNRETV